MLIEIIDSFRGKPKRIDDCGSCRQKVCCTVYKISTYHQGRKESVKKRGGESCKYLSPEGSCTIHSERKMHEGYAQACIDYTCDNTGPLLSSWIDENAIDITTESYEIGEILRKLQVFIGTGSRYEERRNYIAESLLKKYTTPSNLLRQLQNNYREVEKDFHIWADSNPIDSEFDRKIISLIAQGRL